MTDQSTRPATSEVGATMLKRAAADPHRPRFHFVAPAGWLNDPNGLVQRDGIYHLFYQYNPHAPVHERIHWGHAISRDLVRWEDEPVALAPSPHGPDVDGCWSGVLVDDDGVPTLVYSGRHSERELPCVATGSSDLRTWTKDPGNPVISSTPPGVDVTAFRDHCVWRQGGVWRHLVGSGIAGVGGTAFLYESADLRSWELVGPLVVGDALEREPVPGETSVDPLWTGTMWECVDLFRLGFDGSTSVPGADRGSGADVLVFSAWDDGVTHHALYWTGDYDGDSFVPRDLRRLDLGGRYFYAPQSMRDESGRRLMFGWLQEGRSDAAQVEAGWSGVMSLPRVVTLAADGSVHQEPAPEVATLRRDHVRIDAFELAAGTLLSLEEVRGDELDLDMQLVLSPGATAHLVVRQGGPERTVLSVTRRADDQGRVAVRLDRSDSSLDADVDMSERSGDAPMGSDGRVHLRVVLDRSAVEIFVNGVPLTTRVYPVGPDAVGVALGADGADVRVERVDSWRMASIVDGPRSLWPTAGGPP